MRHNGLEASRSPKQQRWAPHPYALAMTLLIGLVNTVCWADDKSSASPVDSGADSSPVAVKREPPPIQDNSFLVEEAYNQEFGVVQHINAFTRSWNSHQWLYTFTQEWPVPGQTHQLSYTLSYLRASDSNSHGLGDIAINYRYQLVGSGETRVALAPRFSLLLPIGNSRLGLGAGGIGVQTNIPVSWVITKRLVTHWNAGATYIPRQKSQAGDRAAAIGYNFGQSFVWLVRPRFNALLESTWTSSQSAISPGRTATSRDLLLNPGIRWAYNFANGLQIVPGVSVPVGIGPSAGDKGVFLYLSFEHPFRKLEK